MSRHLAVGDFKNNHNNRQAGATIIELMVACTIGLIVVMLATTLLLSSKAGYTTQDENVRVQETGRYAVEIISRGVRQAAYENWDRAENSLVNAPTMSAGIAGMDARTLKEGTAGIDDPVANPVNGSDVLAVRFFGAGSGSSGDGTMLNCAGFGVPETDDPEAGRGWSIFFVASDKSGEPELRCKYRGKNSWNAEAIARGVESFQVLYGVDTDADGLPNQFLNAMQIDRLDGDLKLEGPNAVGRLLDKNRKTHWKKVVTVNVAMLVRSAQNARSGVADKRYDLFGPEYAAQHAADDSGTRIDERDLPAASRNRLRKIFSTSIQLRSSASGSGA